MISLKPHKKVVDLGIKMATVLIKPACTAIAQVEQI